MFKRVFELPFFDFKINLKEKSPTAYFFKCKAYVMRQLGNKLKKDLKKRIKSIAEAEKGSTFAPATAKNALRHSGSFMIIEGRNSQKKKI
ncbi:hypothetical protein JI750_17655, partial [Flavobacterium sp. GN10]|nr:hypothetical protein [Flavobacterium tagetis]